METKICKTCGLEKTIIEFELRKDTGKYRNTCKECKSKYDREYRKNNYERLEKLRLLRYDKNKKSEYDKKYYELNKEERKKYQNQYRKNNPKRKEYEKQYREKNKDKIIQYRLEHRNQIRKTERKWREKNKDKITEYTKRKYLKTKTTPILKFKNQLRNMIKDSFKRKKYKKSKKIQEICGCSIDDLINYLIMTYEQNYNVKWDWEYVKNVHIDHIIPLASAKTEEDVIKLCHYSNLQLLKAEDNLKKGSKII